MRVSLILMNDDGSQSKREKYRDTSAKATLASRYGILRRANGSSRTTSEVIRV